MECDLDCIFFVLFFIFIKMLSKVNNYRIRKGDVCSFVVVRLGLIYIFENGESVCGIEV